MEFCNLIISSNNINHHKIRNIFDTGKLDYGIHPKDKKRWRHRVY